MGHTPGRAAPGRSAPDRGRRGSHEVIDAGRHNADGGTGRSAPGRNPRGHRVRRGGVRHGPDRAQRPGIPGTPIHGAAPDGGGAPGGDDRVCRPGQGCGGGGPSGCGAGGTRVTEPEILVLPTSAEASHVAARRIATALTEAVEARGVAHWVTTGGSTPGNIYRHLADAPLRETVPWDRIHLWWGDDRWAPPEDILSTALACWDLLLRDVPIQPNQIHVMPIGEALAAGDGPETVAARYATTLREAGLEIDAGGFPRLDVALVGVGSDGHLLSVFPGSSHWEDPGWGKAGPAPRHIA